MFNHSQAKKQNKNTEKRKQQEMIRAGKHSMDAALGNMTKRMRGDQDKIVDLSNGDGENKPLKGNLMNTYTHARTHTCI